MKKIIISICDDELYWSNLIAETILRYEKKYNKNIEIKLYQSANEYLLDKTRSDILLLDVDMGKYSGIELKNVLEKRMRSEAIIFISEEDSFIRDAFGKNVYGFLDKPYNEKKLYEILNRIIEELQMSVAIRIEDGYIDSSDIVYIKSVDKYVDICTTKDNMIGYFSLKSMEERLPDSVFMRVQRSYIVNLNYITKVGAELHMYNGYKISVGRGKLAELKERHMEYIKRRVLQ